MRAWVGFLADVTVGTVIAMWLGAGMTAPRRLR
jgi:hypothetical protein